MGIKGGDAGMPNLYFLIAGALILLGLLLLAIVR